MLPSPQAQGLTRRIWSRYDSDSDQNNTALEIQPSAWSDHQKAPQARSSRRKAVLICKHKLGFCCLYNFSFQKKNVYFLLTVYTISLYDCFSPIWLYCIYMLVRLSLHSLFWSLTELPESVACSSLQIHKYFHYDVFKYFFLHPLPPWNSVTSVLYCLAYSSRSLSLLISFSVSCCPMPQFGYLTLQWLRYFIMPSSIFC